MAQANSLPAHVLNEKETVNASQEYLNNNNSTKMRRPTKWDYNLNEKFGIFDTLCEKCEEFSDKITGLLPGWDRLIGKMQDMSGMSKRYILALLFCSPFLVFALILASPILTPILLLCYPMMMSVKAIEHKQEARTRWLIYWLFYNTITVSEQFFGPFLHVLPGYSFAKVFIFVWCLVPMNENGCYYAYQIVRPILMIPVRKIDEYVMASVNKIKTVVHANQDFAANLTLNAATMAGSMLANKQDHTKTE